MKTVTPTMQAFISKLTKFGLILDPA